MHTNQKMGVEKFKWSNKAKPDLIALVLHCCHRN